MVIDTVTVAAEESTVIAEDDTVLDCNACKLAVFVVEDVKTLNKFDVFTISEYVVGCIVGGLINDGNVIFIVPEKLLVNIFLISILLLLTVYEPVLILTPSNDILVNKVCVLSGADIVEGYIISIILAEGTNNDAPVCIYIIVFPTCLTNALELVNLNNNGVPERAE